MDYHKRQADEIYRSTIYFFEWLEDIGYLNAESELAILDLACGNGVNLAYMAKRYPKCRFLGIELHPGHVEWGNKILQERGIENAHIIEGDWYDLGDSYRGEFDGIISMQTLSWLPDYREPMDIVCRMDPKWIAMTSLFYDGYVSTTNETHAFDEAGNITRNLFYNVYSIPIVRKFLGEHGYGNFQYKPFEIDVDLPKTGKFQTYTERTDDGRRLQISGPVFVPWHFIAAQGVKDGNGG